MATAGKRTAAVDEGAGNHAANGNKRNRRSDGLDERIDEIKEHIVRLKKLRHREVTVDQKNLILHAYFVLQQGALQQQLDNPEAGRVASNAQERVHELLGVSAKTISSAYIDWKQSGSIKERGALATATASATASASDAQGRKDNSGGAEQQRVNPRRSTLLTVRAYIRSRPGRTAAKDVLEFLLSKGLITAVGPSVKDYRSALRAVQRYLARNGFSKGIDAISGGGGGVSVGNGVVGEDMALLLEREAYLMTLHDNRLKTDAQHLREVYVDESFVHQQQHGLHLSVVAAIRESRPRSNAGLIGNSVWIVRSEDARHCAFNADTFSRWWDEQLLPNLTEPSLIILDNAVYHRALPRDTPNVDMLSKAELAAYLTQKRVTFPPNAMINTLKSLANGYLDQHVKPRIVQAAEHKGHKVLFTPRHHRDLQPMELVWSFVKDRMRKQSKNAPAPVVQVFHQRLEQEFSDLFANHELIGKIIRHIDRAIAQYVHYDNSGGNDEDDEDGGENENEEAFSGHANDSGSSSSSGGIGATGSRHASVDDDFESALAHRNDDGDDADGGHNLDDDDEVAPLIVPSYRHNGAGDDDADDDNRDDFACDDDSDAGEL